MTSLLPADGFFYQGKEPMHLQDATNDLGWISDLPLTNVVTPGCQFLHTETLHVQAGG